MNISVVINTLNEKNNISDAISSVSNWAYEIIVVDMYSDDGTAEIAESLGAKVFQIERMGYADPARAYAVSLAVGDYILVLDADERVPLSLSKKLEEIAVNETADVVIIPWRNFIFGREIRHTGWGMQNDFHPRFFRRGMITFSPEVHNFMHIDQRARVLNLPPIEEYGIVHFNYINIRQFITKMNNYTDAEVKKIKKTNIFKAIILSFYEFIRRFIKLKGYKDGWHGASLSILMMFYTMLSHLKWMEQNKNIQVSKRYDTLSKKIIAGDKI